MSGSTFSPSRGEIGSPASQRQRGEGGIVGARWRAESKGRREGAVVRSGRLGGTRPRRGRRSTQGSSAPLPAVEPDRRHVRAGRSSSRSLRGLQTRRRGESAQAATAWAHVGTVKRSCARAGNSTSSRETSCALMSALARGSFSPPLVEQRPARWGSAAAVFRPARGWGRPLRQR